ncbi:hypothetical protein DNTS_013839 [Danionella cerebrum]|uniref:Uncharacterized protein n=1 Tax=Danionella cerebrum TaxID=2873325 RepID=A0A553QM29_9TELE|nr:hypothetical protein DNTS_013839 [Danionella translucida]
MQTVNKITHSHINEGREGPVMLLHPSVQMMLLLLLILGSQIAPVRMRRAHRLLYNHSGGKKSRQQNETLFYGKVIAAM